MPELTHESVHVHPAHVHSCIPLARRQFTLTGLIRTVTFWRCLDCEQDFPTNPASPWTTWPTPVTYVITEEP